MAYPDWFVLKKLNANINPLRFGELCEGIKLELIKRTAGGRLSNSSPLPAYPESDKSFKDNDGDEESSLMNNNKEV